MRRFDQFILLFNTVKYLKISQILWQVWRRVYRPKLNLKLPFKINLRESSSHNNKKWVESILSSKKYFKKLTGSEEPEFCVLNRSIQIKNIWKSIKSKQEDKLWRYNLNYFDCLKSNHKNQRVLGLKLLDQWLLKTPFYTEDAWEPYVLSLNSVNLIKYELNYFTPKLSQKIINRLYLQGRYLFKTLEHHILANHLFANAKAMVFLGLYFKTAESQKWFNKGLKLLKREIPEQILADGGHFEGSPMYHQIILEDMLDIYNVFQHYQIDIPNLWREKIEFMLNWLNIMTHPNGEIAYFKDSVCQIAPETDKIFNYAGKLGFKIPDKLIDNIYYLKDSGYIRLQKNDFVILINLAPIQPSYQPGHAHADALSFELSYQKQKVFVNSGISSYQGKQIRSHERSSKAHNVLELNGLNSSEVWGSFRVGKRAKIFDIKITKNNTQNKWIISAKHSGYKNKLGVAIQRVWELDNTQIKIIDQIIQSNKSQNKKKNNKLFSKISRFYMHPDCELKNLNLNLNLDSNFNSDNKIKNSEYALGFNQRVNNKMYEVDWGEKSMCEIVLKKI